MKKPKTKPKVSTTTTETPPPVGGGGSLPKPKK